MNLNYCGNGVCTALYLGHYQSTYRDGLSFWDSKSYPVFVGNILHCIEQIEREDDEWYHYEPGPDDFGNDEIRDPDMDPDSTRPYYVEELGIVYSITSSKQEEIEEFLEEFGFNKSERHTSKKYFKESQTTLWWMHAPEFKQRAIDEKVRLKL